MYTCGELAAFIPEDVAVGGHLVVHVLEGVAEDGLAILSYS